MPKPRKSKPFVVETPYLTFEGTRKLHRIPKKDALWVKDTIQKVILNGIVKKYRISKKDAEALRRLCRYLHLHKVR